MVDIWKIMWLFIVVITTFVVIAIYGPALGNAMDATLRQDAKYAASEIAGTISLVGAGPDGTTNVYMLPRLDRPRCVKIYRTYVDVDMNGVASADIVEGVPVNVTVLEGANPAKGDAPATADWDALNVACGRNEVKQLVIARKGGQVRFSVQYVNL